MIRKVLTILVPALGLLLSSCHHKDLVFDSRVGDIEVVFDWRNAPDADPESMALYMYGPEEPTEQRFIFTGRDGGKISITPDTYIGLVMNSDNTDEAVFRGEDDTETFETYTPDAQELTGYGLKATDLPRARDTENERMAKTPGMIWSDRRDSLELHITTTDKKITFYPEENVCHYTVEVRNVKNIEYVQGAALDGTLSGMAEGYAIGRNETTENHVTMPFVLTSDEKDDELTASFLTFGECCTTQCSHILSIYIILSNGEKWYYTYDVTDQVSKAPDPQHVLIVVDGLDIPEPISGGGGFRPDVNDWQTINYVLPM